MEVKTEQGEMYLHQTKYILTQKERKNYIVTRTEYVKKTKQL
jgi:hypothetical protein